MSILDFKLALFGQIYDNEGLLYSYPEKAQQLRMSGQYPAWVNSLPIDSRFLRELVASGGDCFSVRYGKEGLFYLYTRYNPHDSRNGAVSVALYAQNYAASDAGQLILALRNLMDYFLEKQSPIGIADADIAELTKGLSNPYSIKLPTQQQEILRNDVYRVYQSEEELKRYLNWAIQKEYTEYKWVHFISAEHKKAIINPALYTEIKSHLQDCYALKISETSYELVLSGTNRDITYSKAGYLSETVTVVIGQPSKYIEEHNHVINFKKASEIDLKFKKRIRIQLYDSKTKQQILENGTPKILSVEIEEGKTRNVNASALGYKDKMINIDPSKQNTPETTIRENLDPIPQVRHTNSKREPDNDNFLRIRKRPLLISVIVLVLIALGIGFGGGFYIGTSGDVNLNDSIKNSNKYIEEVNKLLEENEQLKDSILQLNEKIVQLNEKIEQQKKPAPTPGNPSDAQKAKQKAIEFLQTTNQWSLYGMRNYITQNQVRNKVSGTDEYKWLTYIMEGEKLDADRLNKIISNTDVLQNAEWTNIVQQIEGKKIQGISIAKFQNAFKNANSHWDSDNGCPHKDTNGNDKKLLDGTIKLSDLKKNIGALKL